MTGRAEVYLRNAAAMWRALIPDAHLDERSLRVELPTATRVLLRAPHRAAALAEIGRRSPAKFMVVEDVFSDQEPTPLTPTSRTLRLPVMNRPAGAVAYATAPDVRVIEVHDPAALAQAERIIVNGFPFPHYQPWCRGQALPPRVLTLPGWRVWLAYLRDTPAAAAYTYDDGYASGVYWLVTHPEHRCRGLARAVLTTAIAERPEQQFALVATQAGRPLYESLGFVTVATVSWHTRPPLASQN